MIYAIMISLESETFSRDAFHEGRISAKARDSILAMLRSTLTAHEDLGGFRSHRLDFLRYHVTVQRVTSKAPDHVDSIVVKPDGIFAKVSIPPEDNEAWEGLTIVRD